MTDSPKIKAVSVYFQAAGAQKPSGESARGPLRIVVLSGLSPGDDYSTRAAAPLDPVPVDKLSFERVLEAVAPALAIEVADPFSPEGAPVRIELRWPDLKAMRADGIADQVPALRALVEARRIAQQAKAGKVSAEDALARLGRILPRPSWASALAGEATVSAPYERAAGRPAAAAGDPLDALFAKVGVKDDARAETSVAPESLPAGPPTGLSALVAAVARGGVAAKPRERAAAVMGTTIERAERAFVRVLTEILAHPEVRRLEESWRGLRLLIDAIDPRSGVEVDVIPAAKEHVLDALRALQEPLGGDARMLATRAPIDLLVVDHDIGATSEDARVLGAWARLAQEMQVPLVANGHPTLLGVDGVLELARASKRFANVDDPRPEPVREVASDEACRWVTVAMNGPLVRAAYSASSSRLRDIPFDEDPKDHAKHVFAGPAIAVGILVARAFVRTGWPCAIVGARDGAVAHLAVHEVEDVGGSFAIPLEVFVTEDIVKGAARAGVALFTCAANHDSALLLRAPVFHKTGLAAPTATLGDQLFVGRFASAVQQVATALPLDVDPQAGSEAARLALGDLFPDAAPSGPDIAARIRSDGKLVVTVHPRRYAGVSLEEVTLTVPLGGA